MEVTELINLAARALELTGVGAIVLGAVVAAAAFVRDLRQPVGITTAYQDFRTGIGRAILLGLEILIAADIIRTVAIEPTFTSVGVLAAIVLIRTFLSLTLQVEITGRWPWQQRGGTEEL